MPESKTEEYRVFLLEKLKSGMYKMQAARALKKEYPHRFLNTCATHVYQWFSGKYNGNYNRREATAERMDATKTTTPKKSPHRIKKKDDRNKPLKRKRVSGVEVIS